ncbi:hypothetical protein DPMN_014074 [Dreissena polymorpha]|uniref:Uncharacterized protein n=1 Tax=Dreissena polymorpha TaxID=45954 RepID=A0A9D4NAZ8_DREPO|nr:hypothetical protein DPMN_014074 [Dreissena polymorpha]
MNIIRIISVKQIIPIIYIEIKSFCVTKEAGNVWNNSVFLLVNRDPGCDVTHIRRTSSRVLETEEGELIEMANKLMDMLHNIHERARTPMTEEMNERRRTLSERQVAHQSDSEASETSTFPIEDMMEVSQSSDPPVFGADSSFKWRQNSSQEETIKQKDKMCETNTVRKKTRRTTDFL